MDQLDRLFHRLVHNIRSRNPAHLSLPFTVAELYEQIVPYRHNRRELGIETNQEYELTVLRLLSGERGYLLGDAAMQERLRREMESRDPDPGTFREYAAAEVSVSASALDQVGAGARQRPNPPAERTAAPSAPAAVSASAAMAENPPVSTGSQATAAAAAPSAAEAAMPVAAATDEPDQNRCRFCGAKLPPGREVKFCPNCGQNLAISRCPACGSEIEAGWKFCITCGRAAGK